jgi:lysophospholipase L1-like esterase
VLDAAAALGREPAMFLEPVHPSPEGHRRLGEALAALLERERML